MDIQRIINGWKQMMNSLKINSSSEKLTTLIFEDNVTIQMMDILFYLLFQKKQ
jgi:hypothetical protein